MDLRAKPELAELVARNTRAECEHYEFTRAMESYIRVQRVTCDLNHESITSLSSRSYKSKHEWYELSLYSPLLIRMDFAFAVALQAQVFLYQYQQEAEANIQEIKVIIKKRRRQRRRKHKIVCVREWLTVQEISARPFLEPMLINKG